VLHEVRRKQLTKTEAARRLKIAIGTSIHCALCNAFSCSPRKRADPDVSNFLGERLPDFPVSWMVKMPGDLTPRRPELFNDKRQLKSYLERCRTPAYRNS